MTQATITNRRLIQQQKEEKEQERILRERRIQVVDENLEENVNQLVVFFSVIFIGAYLFSAFLLLCLF